MQPLIWLGILAALLFIEAITAGLTTIWFAGGALIAAIASYAGANLTIQILLFLIPWRLSHLFFVQTVKIGDIMKSTFHGDFRNTFVRIS